MHGLLLNVHGSCPWPMVAAPLQGARAMVLDKRFERRNIDQRFRRAEPTST
jgi:hypothetical protein